MGLNWGRRPLDLNSPCSGRVILSAIFDAGATYVVINSNSFMFKPNDLNLRNSGRILFSGRWNNPVSFVGVCACNCDRSVKHLGDYITGRQLIGVSWIGEDLPGVLSTYWRGRPIDSNVHLSGRVLVSSRWGNSVSSVGVSTSGWDGTPLILRTHNTGRLLYGVDWEWNVVGSNSLYSRLPLYIPGHGTFTGRIVVAADGLFSTWVVGVPASYWRNSPMALSWNNSGRPIFGATYSYSSKNVGVLISSYLRGP